MSIEEITNEKKSSFVITRKFKGLFRHCTFNYNPVFLFQMINECSFFSHLKGFVRKKDTDSLSLPYDLRFVHNPAASTLVISDSCFYQSWAIFHFMK